MSHSSTNNNKHQASAFASKKLRQLLRQILASGDKVYSNTINLKRQSHGLHVNCGSGVLSYEILDRLGRDVKLLAVDQDPDQIQITQQNAALFLKTGIN